MDKNIIKGNWEILKGKIKENWGNLTDDELTEIGGKKDQLLGKLQKKYGYTKEEAESKIDQFEQEHTDQTE